MKKFILSILGCAALFGGTLRAQNQYGLPEEIKDGNILHCFDWKLGIIKSNLPAIAEAGFVAVQVSPLQAWANGATSGKNWSNLYRPYDFDLTQTGIGTENNLVSLCEEAEKYGIKIIVDVVFNHTDNSPYHDKWWDSNGRLRTTTKMVNYGDRKSITSDRIGDYPEVNSESPEVIARAKAYIEKLKADGVKGIRFDAAKHIALPSEGSNFWKEITSVPGLFYYGEILDSPGGSNANALMKEYTDYMSVTDNSYSATCLSMVGTPSSAGNWSLRGIDPEKLVYWGESHDTYSNAGGTSKNKAQEYVDRAYAIVACRAKGMALYFSRPAAKEFGSILIGQTGSDHFTSPEVAEVNKFKNAMVGREDSFSKTGSAASVTRKGGGAVIVKQSGAGAVEVANGGGYCPPGTYTDRVSGNVFTVTEDMISGTVGASGIAVIYNIDATGINDVTVADTEENAVWYNLQGMPVAAPQGATGQLYIKVYPSGKSVKVLM